jgi:hypothetical protein
MGWLGSFKHWQADRKERHIERLTAKAVDLNEDQQYDLLFLHERGFIRAKGSGQSITKIYAEVENLIRKKLHVIVKPGTYFVSSGSHQNMATTSEYTFTLYPCSTEQLGINATCINADRPIPGKEDRFYGVARVSEEVARFLEASKSEDPMVIQAGVWTLTDNYSRYDVMNHLISKDGSGNIRHPVTHEHCDQAKAILEQLGIPHRLWYSDIAYEKKTVEYNNGDKYVGEFRYGERHGQGLYTYSDGSSYEGQWKNGLEHGQGKHTSKDGISYEGEWKAGKRHGRGKFMFSEVAFYEGEFKNDEFHGQGVQVYDNGKYIGEFKRGKRHGKGKYTWMNGSSHDGDWKEGEPHGQGISIEKDGGKYIGEFRFGKKHGQGEYVWANGSSFEGEWDNDFLKVQNNPIDHESPKKVEKFDGTKESGGWLHFTDGTKQWIFVNSKGEWEVGAPPDSLA